MGSALKGKLRDWTDQKQSNFLFWWTWKLVCSFLSCGVLLHIWRFLMFLRCASMCFLSSLEQIYPCQVTFPARECRALHYDLQYMSCSLEDSGTLIWSLELINLSSCFVALEMSHICLASFSPLCFTRSQTIFFSPLHLFQWSLFCLKCVTETIIHFQQISHEYWMNWLCWCAIGKTTSGCLCTLFMFKYNSSFLW